MEFTPALNEIMLNEATLERIPSYAGTGSHVGFCTMEVIYHRLGRLDAGENAVVRRFSA